MKVIGLIMRRHRKHIVHGMSAIVLSSLKGTWHVAMVHCRRLRRHSRSCTCGRSQQSCSWHSDWPLFSRASVQKNKALAEAPCKAPEVFTSGVRAGPCRNLSPVGGARRCLQLVLQIGHGLDMLNAPPLLAIMLQSDLRDSLRAWGICVVIDNASPSDDSTIIFFFLGLLVLRRKQDHQQRFGGRAGSRIKLQKLWTNLAVLHGLVLHVFVEKNQSST